MTGTLSKSSPHLGRIDFATTLQNWPRPIVSSPSEELVPDGDFVPGHQLGVPVTQHGQGACMTQPAPMAFSSPSDLINIRNVE